MSAKEKKGVHGKYSPSNYTFGSDCGSQKTAFVENGIIQPDSIVANDASSYASKFEGQSYPKAIMSRLYQYNNDFNLPASATNKTYISNEYFAQTCTQNGDALLNTASGTATTQNESNGSVLGAVDVNSNNVFPLLPLAVTSSSAVYKAQ